ncbi:MAG TPA: outer membrane beta-barrel protein [Gammaproteobacteria bacterium]
MKNLKITFLITLLLSPLTSYADAYFFIAAGNSELDEPGFEDDSALKIGFGNQISDGLAFEFSSLDLGEFEATPAALAEISAFVGETVTGASVEITGLDFSLLGIAPVNDTVSFRGRIGLYLWDAEVDVSVAGFGSGSVSDDGNDIGFGFGLAFDLSENAALTFMYDQYEAFDADIELLNAGIKIGF